MMLTEQNILFIGLGNMGFPMAGHLANAGFNVKVFNRSPAKVANWLANFKGIATSSHVDLVENCNFVVLCVGKDDDVRELLTDDNGIISRLAPNTIIIDHSTTSTELATDMAKAAELHNCFYVDAPVSGGQQGAINGQLSLMVGCDDVVFERVKAVTAPYTKAIVHMGPVGSGQKTKMVNQICVAGLIEALAEGLFFAERAGLDTQKVMDVVSQGAASSWQLVNRHKTMIAGEYEHGFAVDLMQKDLAICLQEASELKIELPATRAVSGFYADLQADQLGHCDTSALLLRLQKRKSAG
ncbi:MAG: NAD(P)-dependent oxidoreductase [Thalassolituus sp.]|uniref:NAD(P)-dependent oxidoreductase n=1 Tax=Thalassolituus sp. TaxID=2030822 RepID=UPI003981EF7F